MKLFYLLYLLFSIHLSAQTFDYGKYKDSLNIFCTTRDSANIESDKTRLESLDTHNITQNIHLYYRDLAWCYYLRYGMGSKISDLDHAIRLYQLSIHHRGDYSLSLWDISICYFLKGDCSHTLLFLRRYLDHSKKNQRDKQQIKQIKQQCK